MNKFEDVYIPKICIKITYDVCIEINTFKMAVCMYCNIDMWNLDHFTSIQN